MRSHRRLLFTSLLVLATLPLACGTEQVGQRAPALTGTHWVRPEGAAPGPAPGFGEWTLLAFFKPT